MTRNSWPPRPPPMRARSGARPSPTPRSQRPDRGVGDCLEPWSNWRGAGWPGGESSEQVRVSSAVELVRTREVGDKREGRTRTNGRGSREENVAEDEAKRRRRGEEEAEKKRKREGRSREECEEESGEGNERRTGEEETGALKRGAVKTSLTLRVRVRE